MRACCRRTSVWSAAILRERVVAIGGLLPLASVGGRTLSVRRAAQRSDYRSVHRTRLQTLSHTTHQVVSGFSRTQRRATFSSPAEAGHYTVRETALAEALLQLLQLGVARAQHVVGQLGQR